MAVGAVTVVAGETLLAHGMVVLKTEEGLNLGMTLEASRRIFSGIDDGLATAAAERNVKAAGTMTGFTTQDLPTIR